MLPVNRVAGRLTDGKKGERGTVESGIGGEQGAAGAHGASGGKAAGVAPVGGDTGAGGAGRAVDGGRSRPVGSFPEQQLGGSEASGE